jgi:hypothetical protein
MSALQWRRRVALTTFGLLVCAATAAPAGAEVAPGRSLELDTSIELGIVDGYPKGSQVRVDVVRGTTLIATKTIAGGGAVDINHVGGADCWDGVPAGMSPDARGGDKLVATVLDADGNPTADVDFMYLRDIAFTESSPNLITGTAFGIPAGGAFQATAPMAGDTMDIQRRADARFSAIITVQPDGSFSTPLDGPANQGEVFVNHTDTTGGGTGITTVEPGGNGASACGARLTTGLSSASHSIINAANVTSDLIVGGPRLAPTTVTEVTFAGKAYVPANAADTWSLTIPAADLAALADNADHNLGVAFSDGSPAQTRVIRKDVTAPVVSSTVAPGSYATAQSVALFADGGEPVRYTLDGSEPRATSKAYDGVPITLANGNHTIRAMAADAAGNRTVSTFAYAIGADSAPALQAPVLPVVTPLRPSGRSLAITGLSVRKRIRANTARRRGLRLTMRLARGTRVLELRIYRKAGDRRKLVARLVRLPQHGGAYVADLKDANVRKALTPGLYTVIATPGGQEESGLHTAERATATFRIVVSG